MKRARWVGWVALTTLASAAGALGCRDACNEGAYAKNGMCVPICPSVTCGDNVCMRYVWPDGSWNKELRCETQATCAKDCSNLDQNLAQAIFFMLLEIDSDSNLPNPASNQSGSATCSGGGQVALSGSRWCQDIGGGAKTCLHDVSYSFTNCVAASAWPEARLTFASGTLRAYSAYQDPSTGPVATQISGQVTLSGTVSVGYLLDAAAQTLPQASCAMDYYQTTGGQFTTTGTMCGRAITMPVYQPDSP